MPSIYSVTVNETESTFYCRDNAIAFAAANSLNEQDVVTSNRSWGDTDPLSLYKDNKPMLREYFSYNDTTKVFYTEFVVGVMKYDSGQSWEPIDLMVSAWNEACAIAPPTAEQIAAIRESLYKYFMYYDIFTSAGLMESFGEY